MIQKQAQKYWDDLTKGKKSKIPTWAKKPGPAITYSLNQVNNSTKSLAQSELKQSGKKKTFVPKDSNKTKKTIDKLPKDVRKSFGGKVVGNVAAVMGGVAGAKLSEKQIAKSTTSKTLRKGATKSVAKIAGNTAGKAIGSTTGVVVGGAITLYEVLGLIKDAFSGEISVKSGVSSVSGAAFGWVGAITGGLVGLLIGGPIGSIIGALIFGFASTSAGEFFGAAACTGVTGFLTFLCWMIVLIIVGIIASIAAIGILNILVTLAFPAAFFLIGIEYTNLQKKVTWLPLYGYNQKMEYLTQCATADDLFMELHTYSASWQDKHDRATEYAKRATRFIWLGIGILFTAVCICWINNITIVEGANTLKNLAMLLIPCSLLLIPCSLIVIVWYTIYIRRRINLFQSFIQLYIKEIKCYKAKIREQKNAKEEWKKTKRSRIMNWLTEGLWDSKIKDYKQSLRYCNKSMKRWEQELFKYNFRAKNSYLFRKFMGKHLYEGTRLYGRAVGDNQRVAR